MTLKAECFLVDGDRAYVILSYIKGHMQSQIQKKLCPIEKTIVKKLKEIVLKWQKLQSEWRNTF